MSGHSKWATIKHRKGQADAKRSKTFSKIAKEITVAARLGGGDPSSNPRLRTAIATAKGVSMPGKNIDNAVKKGTGENKDGVEYFEITYEGYGPHGVAVLVDCLTDNKNRTVAGLRTMFSKNQGNLGEAGSVSWQFEKKGVLHIERSAIDEEKMTELALELGADDVQVDEEGYTLLTSPEAFNEIYETLGKKLPRLEDNAEERNSNSASASAIVNAEITMVAKNNVPVNMEQSADIERLLNLLDDHEDVKSVSSNEELSN